MQSDNAAPFASRPAFPSASTTAAREALMNYASELFFEALVETKNRETPETGYTALRKAYAAFCAARAIDHSEQEHHAR